MLPSALSLLAHDLLKAARALQAATNHSTAMYFNQFIEYITYVRKLLYLLWQYTITGFLPICENQIERLFKDFQGPYEGYTRRTKLNQTGTFISIYKCCKLPSGRKWILCTFDVRKKPSGTPFSVSTGSVTAF